VSNTGLIISHPTVRAAVDEFLGLLIVGQGDEAANLDALCLALDRLALASHFVGPESEVEHPDPPVRDAAQLRQVVTARFPMLGYYNVPSTLTTQIMEADLQVGDAVDDVADIASDLLKVKWCWEHTSDNDALWRFRWGYEYHWGEHLRNLQRYLHALRYGD